jgi:hypothetical protein
MQPTKKQGKRKPYKPPPPYDSLTKMTIRNQYKESLARLNEKKSIKPTLR